MLLVSIYSSIELLCDFERPSNEDKHCPNLTRLLNRSSAFFPPTAGRSGAIEELRRSHLQGTWICANLRGGYFMARDEAELDRYLQSDEKRALHMLQRVRIQREAAGLQPNAQLDLL